MADAILKLLGSIVAIVVLVVAVMFLNAWVADYFYDWFVLPVFPKAPDITLVQFIGLSFFLGSIISTGSSSSDKDDKKSTEDKVADFTYKVLLRFIVFFVGYLVHVFIY